MRKGFGLRIPLAVAIAIAAGVGCRGDTVLAACAIYPVHIVLLGEYPFTRTSDGRSAVTLDVGAEQNLLLALPANEVSDWENCGVPPGNRFVWSTLDPTVARIYATGDSTARVRAVSAGKTVVRVRAEPDTTYRATRGVTVVP